jgi:hypothetical protein
VKKFTYSLTSYGALKGQTLIQMLHPVQSSSLTVTTSLIMLMAMAGQRSIQPPHPVHLFVSILVTPITSLEYMHFFLYFPYFPGTPQSIEQTKLHNLLST